MPTDYSIKRSKSFDLNQKEVVWAKARETALCMPDSACVPSLILIHLSTLQSLKFSSLTRDEWLFDGDGTGRGVIVESDEMKE